MLLFFLIFSLFFVACDGEKFSANVDQYEKNGYEEECQVLEFAYDLPQIAERPLFGEIPRYDSAFKCEKLPEIQNGKLILSGGCFLGCLKIEGSVFISGSGSRETLILCDDASSKAVVELSENSSLVLENVSLSGDARGIFVNKNSELTLNRVSISNSLRGGVNVCPDEGECNSVVNLFSSFIGDVMESDSGVSYGISVGKALLNIEDSLISGFNSFGIAVWGGGEDEAKARVKIKNSIISNGYGGTRGYDGHAIYVENSAAVTLEKVLISDIAASFLLASGDKGEVELNLVDFTAENILESSGEQGGIVLEGAVKANFERAFVSGARGYGIFVKGAEARVEDLTIKSLSPDGLGNGGFGLQLVDGSKTFFRRLLLSGCEKAAVLMDGNAFSEIDNFEIVSTKSDSYTSEFGIGVAVQNGGEIVLRNGLIARNRESGVMAIKSKIEMENVEISESLPRDCIANGGCSFAPEVEFGHGISLYKNSEFKYKNLNISNNNNGLNVEDSNISAKENGTINFWRNITAVNAWNLSDFDDFSANLTNSIFCDNRSVFTSDEQPVRENF